MHYSHQRIWTEWDHYLERIEELILSTVYAENDIGILLEQEAVHLGQIKQKDRAKKCWNLADEIWIRLGDEGQTDLLSRRPHHN